MLRKGIIAGGNWIIDRVKSIDAWPNQDELANILSETESNGGAPYNVLKDLALLQSEVSLDRKIPLQGIGLIGSDPAGDFILQDCRLYGIDVSKISITDRAPTSYTDVMVVRTTGRRTFFHCRGANALLDDSHFDFSNTSAKHFHLGYLLLLDALDSVDAEFGTVAARVLHRAKLAGMTTSLDLVSDASGRFQDVVTPSLRYADIVFMNEYEASRLCGDPIVSAKDQLIETARNVLDLGAPGWVIIHQETGAVAASTNGQSFSQGAVKVPSNQIAGTVGAGDAFAAGVIMAMHENIGMELALRLGACCSAACITHERCSEGISTFLNCQKMGDTFGFRSFD